MPTQRRTIPRTWEKIVSENDLSDIFSEYDDLLAAIDATEEDAFDRMFETQQDAITNYTTEYIYQIFHNNLVAHAKKYAELVAFYQKSLYPFDSVALDETYSSTRTPELTSTSLSVGTGTSDSERKQSITQTNTPDTTTTNTHSVNPYNDSGFRPETEDSTTESGSNTNVTSFSGSPDHVATSSSASSTVTQGGQDVLETERLTVGRNGRRFLFNEIMDSGLQALEKIDVLDLIIDDLADAIFLQVWL